MTLTVGVSSIFANNLPFPQPPAAIEHKVSMGEISALAKSTLPSWLTNSFLCGHFQRWDCCPLRPCRHLYRSIHLKHISSIPFHGTISFPVVKSVQSGFRLPGFKSQLCHLTGIVNLKANYLMCFFTFKSRILKPVFHKAVVRYKSDNPHKMLSTVPGI